MGNGSSTQQQQTLFQDISQNYQEVRREVRGTVLMHRDSQANFLLK